jgi:hypothetical protein
MIVFQALGIVVLAVLHYHTGGQNLFKAELENLAWLPLLTVIRNFKTLPFCSVSLSPPASRPSLALGLWML